MSEWGDRIAQKMAETKSSQASLARSIGISQPSVNDWLSGKTRMIDGLNLVRVARALGTTPEWIMTGRASPSQSARYDPATIADAMMLLDEYDSVLGRTVEQRPSPARLAIACEVVAGGPLEQGRSVVVRLADRLRQSEAENGDDAGAIEGNGEAISGSVAARKTSRSRLK